MDSNEHSTSSGIKRCSRGLFVACVVVAGKLFVFAGTVVVKRTGRWSGNGFRCLAWLFVESGMTIFRSSV